MSEKYINEKQVKQKFKTDSHSSYLFKLFKNIFIPFFHNNFIKIWIVVNIPKLTKITN